MKAIEQNRGLDWEDFHGNGGKCVYDTATNSYQIWLEKPGLVQDGYYDERIVLDDGINLNHVVIPMKFPAMVEFEEGLVPVQDYMRTATQEGTSEADTDVLEAEACQTVPSLPKWRVEIDVYAYDITQVMSEAMIGTNARITRVYN